jgi:predicted RNA-binding Zn ribbon-like protein
MPTTEEPANERPATERLDATNVAIEFANIGYDTDDASPELTVWAGALLAPAAFGRGVLERVVDLHTAVRSVLEGCIDDDMLQRLDAVAALNETSSVMPVSPVLIVRPDGTVTADIAQSTRDLSGLLASVARSTIDVVSMCADRLRRCEGPGCGRYFLKDRAHRNWCSLGCGNRARVARHYSRHAPHQSPIASNPAKGHR